MCYHLNCRHIWIFTKAKLQHFSQISHHFPLLFGKVFFYDGDYFFL